MADGPDIATVAALFGDPVRATMLIALLDRAVLSAGELAIAANVSPQTASFHLSRLTSGSLLIAARRGRNQVYRLAGTGVASAIESLAAISCVGVQRPETNRFRSEKMRQLRAARTCYDHLAGIAGVLFHDSLLRLDYLTASDGKHYALTAKGSRWFSDFGSAELLERRSPFARQCVDWSEQQPHLAGRLAAFLLDRFLADRWIARLPDTRAVRITERGLREFERRYGINVKAGASL